MLTAQKLGYDMEEVRKRFPIETGEYGLHINWFVHKKLWATLNGSFEYINYRDNWNDVDQFSRKYIWILNSINEENPDET